MHGGRHLGTETPHQKGIVASRGDASGGRRCLALQGVPCPGPVCDATASVGAQEAVLGGAAVVRLPVHAVHPVARAPATCVRVTVFTL